MYKFIVLIAFVAAVVALPQYKDPVPILKSASDVRWDGSYNFHYESGDGSIRVEEGNIVNKGAKDEYVAVKGSYRYILPDGRTVEVAYTADDRGFVPSAIVFH